MRAGVLVEELDLAGVEVDRRRLVVDAHVDAPLAVLLRRPGDEPARRRRTTRPPTRNGMPQAE